MFNPFPLMKEKQLTGFRDRLKKPYLVSQTLRNVAPDPEGKTNILLCDYDDKGLAMIHQKSVLQDKYAALIDLNNEKHFQTVWDMLQPESRYRVYCAFTEDKQIAKTILNRYEANIRNYIRKAGWKPERGAHLHPHVELVFGELFVTLKYGSEKRKFRLEKLERY